jgi:hypothetical protein
MKVKELIEKLQELPDDLYIFLPFAEKWDVKVTELKWLKTKGYYIHPDSYKHIVVKLKDDIDESKDLEIVVLF